mmetsp:Transcript_34602/g.85811  ORF Transcript_34602/g.85811 Transcript_34602/m.85811 type:complete len:668 (-) Transcript_34602:191-2194(-)
MHLCGASGSAWCGGLSGDLNIRLCEITYIKKRSVSFLNVVDLAQPDVQVSRQLQRLGVPHICEHLGLVVEQLAAQVSVGVCGRRGPRRAILAPLATAAQLVRHAIPVLAQHQPPQPHQLHHVLVQGHVSLQVVFLVQHAGADGLGDGQQTGHIKQLGGPGIQMLLCVHFVHELFLRLNLPAMLLVLLSAARCAGRVGPHQPPVVGGRVVARHKAAHQQQLARNRQQGPLFECDAAGGVWCVGGQVCECCGRVAAEIGVGHVQMVPDLGQVVSELFGHGHSRHTCVAHALVYEEFGNVSRPQDPGNVLHLFEVRSHAAALHVQHHIDEPIPPTQQHTSVCVQPLADIIGAGTGSSGSSSAVRLSVHHVYVHLVPAIIYLHVHHHLCTCIYTAPLPLLLLLLQPPVPRLPDGRHADAVIAAPQYATVLIGSIGGELDERHGMVALHLSGDVERPLGHKHGDALGAVVEAVLLPQGPPQLVVMRREHMGTVKHQDGPLGFLCVERAQEAAERLGKLAMVRRCRCDFPFAHGVVSAQVPLQPRQELEPGGLGAVAAPPQVHVHDWPWREVAEERPHVGALAATRGTHYLETPTVGLDEMAYLSQPLAAHESHLDDGLAEGPAHPVSLEALPDLAIHLLEGPVVHHIHTTAVILLPGRCLHLVLVMATVVSR